MAWDARVVSVSLLASAGAPERSRSRPPGRARSSRIGRTGIVAHDGGRSSSPSPSWISSLGCDLIPSADPARCESEDDTRRANEDPVTSGNLLNAWRDASRAAELSERLARQAADAAEQADLTADVAEEVASLAETAAGAAVAAS